MTEQTAPTPAFGDVLPFTGGDWLDLPDAPAPYFLIAKDGPWIHRRTAQGRGVVKSDKTPPKLQKLEAGFKWEGPEIPATIYAQAVHFFRRIWEKHGTEAEVLITQHKTTKEYRLFVPTQRVTGTSVHSIYNPAHIDRNYLVVGTFHSHCDFTPFHSGTDEGDARDMDGIHGTIGFVDQPTPQMDLMYALNVTFFEWDPDEVDGVTTYRGVVDMTNIFAAAAPEWWDRYVIVGQVTDADRQKIAPYADDEAWKDFRGQNWPKSSKPTVMTPNRTSDQTRQWFEGNGYYYDNNLGGYRPQPLKESEDFNRRAEQRRARAFDDHEYGHTDFGYRAYPNPSWDDDDYGALLPSQQETRSADLYKIVGDDEFWEDTLPKNFVSTLLQTDLFVEDDLERAIRDFPASGTPDYWQKRMRIKLLRAVGWMRDQGFEVNVAIKDPVKPVKGQTTVIEYLEAPDRP